jgi:hypothetical protein
VTIGFQSEYDPANWTFTNTNADGSVNTSNAPTSIALTGGNNGPVNSGITYYTIIAAGDGIVTFDWSYVTSDGRGSFFDPLVLLLNGTPTQQLTDNNGGLNQTGTNSFSVSAGDTFGFGIETLDNMQGAASTTFSNFSVPSAPAAAVPEPMTILGTVTALGFGAAFKRRQAKS